METQAPYKTQQTPRDNPPENTGGATGVHILPENIPPSMRKAMVDAPYVKCTCGSELFDISYRVKVDPMLAFFQTVTCRACGHELAIKDPRVPTEAGADEKSSA